MIAPGVNRFQSEPLKLKMHKQGPIILSATLQAWAPRAVARRLRQAWRKALQQLLWRLRRRQLAHNFARTASAKLYGTLLQNPHAEAILRDFRWREYQRVNPDLHFDSEAEAKRHFVYNGYAEQRLVDLDRCNRLDPGYYRRRYPELGLTSDATAQAHYACTGYYENLYANADTEWIAEATLHIFQPGKVGSHAIAAAIEGRYPGGALHLHWPTDLALHYPACSLSYSAIVNRSRARPLRMISASREIVSHVLSGAFQYLSTAASDAGTDLDAEHVLAYLDDAFQGNAATIGGWFDHRFYCGLDIYAHPFDHQRGWIRIRHPTIDLFLYRVESLPQIEADLGAFLELPDFRLGRANAAESKRYRDAYRELMIRYTVPQPLLESLYATPYMRYFFSAQEREGLMQHWSRPRRLAGASHLRRRLG